MSFPTHEQPDDPTPTRPLTQPVHPPVTHEDAADERVVDQGAVDETPTEVINAPGPWAETAHDVRSWSSRALAGLRKHRAFATRQQTFITLILAVMVCAAVVMFVVAALSPDGGTEPARSLPLAHIP